MKNENYIQTRNFFLTILFTLITTLCYSQGIPDFNEESASKNIGFVENKGQIVTTEFDSMPEVLFYSIQHMPRLFFFNNKITFVIEKPDTVNNDSMTVFRIDMTWVGENKQNSTPTVSETRDDIINYYTGSCPSGCDSLPINKRITYEDIYPNVDLQIYSNNSGIKFYFIVNPGGNPSDIELYFNGQNDLSIVPGGLALQYVIGGYPIVLPNGIVYQVDGGNSIDTLSWFNSYTSPSTNHIKLNTGTYDSTKKLVYELTDLNHSFSGSSIINLTWATEYGAGCERFWDVDLDSYGAPYICGYASFGGFPSTVGQQRVYGDYDAAMVHFDEGDCIKWSTVFGGKGVEGDRKYGITVTKDGTPKVYVMFSSKTPTGITNDIVIKSFGTFYNSSNRPGAEEVDYLLARFTRNGILEWSTMLNFGTEADDADVAIDDNLDLYAVGHQSDPIFTHTTEWMSTTSGGFISKFKTGSDGTLQWCTGTGEEWSFLTSVEIDHSNRPVVVGRAAGGISLVDPSGNNTAYQQSNASGSGHPADDGIIMRFNTNLTRNWVTYFGGVDYDEFKRVAISTNNDITAVGYTTSNDLSTMGPVSHSYQGYQYWLTGENKYENMEGDAMIASFNSSGVQTIGGYVGGSNAGECLYSVSASTNNLIFAGPTASNNIYTIAASGSYLRDSYLNHAKPASSNESMIYGINSNSPRNIAWGTYFGGLNNAMAADGERDMLFGSAVSTVNQDHHYVYFVGSTRGNTDNPDPTQNFPFVSSCYFQNPKNYVTNAGLVVKFEITNSILDGLKDMGTDHNTVDNFTIYPNPASSKLSILNTKSTLKSIRIADIQGRIQFDTGSLLENNVKGTTIEINNLNCGVYFIEITTDTDYHFVQKFIKQ